MSGKTAFLLVVALILLQGCSGEKDVKSPESQKYKRVLLVGIDGAPPQILETMMAEGELPNFARLKDQGTYRRLRTSNPAESPVAWTSIATGTNPGKHNMYDFIRVRREDYIPELALYESKAGAVTGSFVRAEPFWKFTSDSGIPSTIVRWPVTFPVKPLNGRLLAGLGVPDVKGYLNSYRLYTSALIDPKAKGSEKSIKVEIKGSAIETYIGGPFTSRGSQRAELKVPMRVSIEGDGKSAIILIQDKSYLVKVGGWSGWLRVSFRVDSFKQVKGIARAYLISAKPDFRLYLTTVQFDPQEPFEDISYPKGYSKELAGAIGLYYTLGMPEDTNALEEGALSDAAFIEQIKQIEEERTKMFWHEFNRFDSGVLAVVFDASDRLMHMSWGGEEITKPVREYFRDKDALLGEILSRMDNDTALVVFSDHGFTDFNKAVDMNRWLVENGFMSLTGEPPEGDEGGLYKYVDWSRTKAYAAGFSSVYINVKGREARGIVELSEREDVVRDIVAKLAELADNETGEKVVGHSYRREDAYHGANVEEAPDIVVGFNRGYRMSWQTAVGGLSREAIMPNERKWQGDHLVDPPQVPGILFTNFRMGSDKPSLEDIAPTILALLGLQAPAVMDGKSLIQ